MGGVVKVRGEMTYEAGKPGQVRVRADYTFVYPMARPATAPRGSPARSSAAS
ncbi:hypothetical protein SGLAM104S_04448 [Streptomyces glaucescens]